MHIILLHFNGKKNLQLQRLQISRYRNLIINRKLLQSIVTCPNRIDFILHTGNFILHHFGIPPFMRFFGLQFVLLLNALDSARRSVPTVFERASSLFHAHYFFPGQAPELQLPVQVPDWYAYQFIVGNVDYWGRRQWGLLYIMNECAYCYNPSDNENNWFHICDCQRTQHNNKWKCNWQFGKHKNVTWYLRNSSVRFF